MKKTLVIALLITACFIQKTNAQGCVAIKSVGNASMLEHPDSTSEKYWQVSTTNRYFRSFRHFSGTKENVARLTDGSAVINHQESFDIGITHAISNRWSYFIDIPILSNARSSEYEHGLVNGVYIKKERHTMHTFGIGDVRAALYAWVLDPKKHSRFNVQVGLGIKLPTGDYNAQDYWYNVGPNGSKELRPVDPSIQLGDGGTGFTAEINAFAFITRQLSVYTNGYYLSNPREQNGTRTYRETLSPALANEAITSVPDQYLFRAGLNYALPVKGLSVSGGARLEGIPVNDLIGGSDDFRRPGYIWSIEPSVYYTYKKYSAYVSVPWAVYRNRTQSNTDKENSAKTGTHVQGDAAFADYVVNVGFSVRF